MIQWTEMHFEWQWKWRDPLIQCWTEPDPVEPLPECEWKAIVKVMMCSRTSSALPSHCLYYGTWLTAKALVLQFVVTWWLIMIDIIGLSFRSVYGRLAIYGATDSVVVKTSCNKNKAKTKTSSLEAKTSTETSKWHKTSIRIADNRTGVKCSSVLWLSSQSHNVLR